MTGAWQRAAWRWGPVVLRSERVRNALAGLAGLALARCPAASQWRRSVTLATGSEPDAGLTRRAVTSGARAYLESFALPGLDPARVVAAVTTVPAAEAVLRAAFAGPGAVLALPHLGSYDWAGAWATATGMPVATVAEKLDDATFAAFKAFREGLGFKVYAHTDPDAVRMLCIDVTAGWLVCLVADRTFDGPTLDVTWPTPRGPIRATAPAGPAVIARRTGAVLLGAAPHYTANGLHLDFSAPIEHRPGREGLVAMTQDLTTFFAAHVARHPEDWHVYQPFFPDDTPDHPVQP